MHTDWSSLYSSIDVNTTCDLFSKSFLQSLNKNIPLVTKTISNKLISNKSWITKGIIKSIHRKNSLYRLSLKLNTEESVKNTKPTQIN